MNFEEFCNEVKENIWKYLPAEMENIQMEMVTNNKQNIGEMTGICFKTPDLNIAPVVYLDQYYDLCNKELLPMDSVMEEIAGMAVQGLENSWMTKRDINGINFADWESVKDNVEIHAMGYTNNKNLLEDVPHRRQGDIAAVYRIHVFSDKNVTGSAMITNENMKLWGITQQQLHDQALSNTQAKLAATCTPIGQVIGNILGTEVEDVGAALYVLTNTEMVNGAAVIFYPDVFDKVSRALPEGFYVLPSSLHEVLVVSKNAGEKEDFEMMVRSVNETEVLPEDRLSDYVHEYDAQKKELTASEVPAPEIEVKTEKPERRI